MLNKLDRLATELKLSAGEAAARLTSIVAHANMIWSAFDSEHFMREADAVLAAEQQQQQQQQQRDAADDRCVRGGVCEGTTQPHNMHTPNTHVHPVPLPRLCCWCWQRRR
jgi:ribosome assembly protein 1